jgi:outer membrane protein assembly factor BamC
LQFSDDEAHYDRYQIRIESGIQPESAEVHILHHQVEASGTPDVNAVWPKVSTADTREAWMVDELSSTLAGNLQRSSSSLLAQTIGGEYKVVLQEAGDGEPVLIMKIEYLRAWASIAHALDKDGFYLWDRKSDLGVFYSYYEEEGSSRSTWIGRGFRSVGNALTGKAKKDNTESPYTLDQIIEHLPESEDAKKLFPEMVPSTDILKDVPGYLIHVSGDDRNVEVRVRNPYGEKIDIKEAKQVLSLVRNNLI